MPTKIYLPEKLKLGNKCYLADFQTSQSYNNNGVE